MLNSTWGDMSADDPSLTFNAAQNALQAASNGSLSWQGVIDSVSASLPKLAATYQQKQVIDAQLARMRAGQPPLDASQYGIGVSVGVSPQIQTYMLIGGVALAAFLLFKRSR